MAVLLGDFKQLPPVLDSLLPVTDEDRVATRDAEKSKIPDYGKLVYHSFNSFFVLDQPVRQGDGPLLDSLTDLREGRFSERMLLFLNSRWLQNLSQQEQANFKIDTDKCLKTATYRDSATMDNATYTKIFDRVAVFRAFLRGAHVENSKGPKIGMAKSIPTTLYLAVGMMVKLLINLVPECGLFNNSRGVVMDIVYPGDGSYPGYSSDDFSSRSPVVWVLFRDYRGPSFFPLTQPDRAQWYPVGVCERRCADDCCSRTGLPLLVAKTDTGHSLQGLTAGQREAIERVLLAGWTKRAEQQFPGSLYVALSRVKAAEDVALESPISADDLQIDRNKSSSWRAQSAEMERIRERAFAARQANPVSRQQFAQTILAFCDRVAAAAHDGIDAERRALIASCAQQWRTSAERWLEAWQWHVQELGQHADVELPPCAELLRRFSQRLPGAAGANPHQ